MSNYKHIIKGKFYKFPPYDLQDILAHDKSSAHFPQGWPPHLSARLDVPDPAEPVQGRGSAGGVLPAEVRGTGHSGTGKEGGQG